MKLKYVILLSTVFLTFLQANDEKVDCLILEDENSIICKYSHERVSFEKNITVQWIEPDGSITRTRDMVIPEYHGSVYDYRYVQGRTKGEWTFKVIDNKEEFTTNFTIK
ncbi:MAG: hypothetical protein WBG69_01580 [Arcobacteraceae bacterium]